MPLCDREEDARHLQPRLLADSTTWGALLPLGKIFGGRRLDALHGMRSGESARVAIMNLTLVFLLCLAVTHELDADSHSLVARIAFTDIDTMPLKCRKCGIWYSV